MNEPDPVGDPVQNGVAGAAVKGLIEGASISVVDANGETVPGAVATTDADGGYSIMFTPSLTPIPQPIQVIVNGTGATSKCDVDVADTDNDCLNADGTTYAKFGDTFTLPSGFEMRAVLTELPEAVAGGSEPAKVNPNPFTEIATAIALAGGDTLTETSVDDANAQVLGIIQILFPTIDINDELESGNFNLNSIPIPDITDLENEDTATTSALSYAMAALAGSIAALVDPDDAEYADLSQVLSTITTAVSTGVTNGDLATIGTASAGVFSTIVDELEDIPDVALPQDLSIADLQTDAGGAAVQAVILNSDPTGTPDIPDIGEPPIIPSTEELALVASKAGISSLSTMVEAFVDLTNYTDNGAVAASSPLGMFDEQFNQIEYAFSMDSTMAIEQLMDAADEAVRQIKLGNGTGDNNDTWADADSADGLVYTVTGSSGDTGSSFTITNATSTYGGVTVTMASGTRTTTLDAGVEATGTFDAPAVTMVTKADDVTLQTFTGSLSATFTAESNGLGLTSMAMAGDVNIVAVNGGTAGGDWGIEINLSGLTGVVGVDISATGAGSFNATFNLGVVNEDEMIITLAGTRTPGIGTVDSYSIEIGDQKVYGSVQRAVAGNGDITDTTTLTDQNDSVTLTLTTLIPVAGASSATGVLVSLGIQTGTMDAAGNITYIDETVQNLNAAIFN